MLTLIKHLYDLFHKVDKQIIAHLLLIGGPSQHYKTPGIVVYSD